MFPCHVIPVRRGFRLLILILLLVYLMLVKMRHARQVAGVGFVCLPFCAILVHLLILLRLCKANLVRSPGI